MGLNPPPGIIIYSLYAIARWRSIVFGFRDYDSQGNLTDWWDGSCFGFATSSFLFFDDYLTLNDYFPGKANLYDVLNNDDSRMLINQYFIYQYGQDHYDYVLSNYNNSPVQTLNDCKQMFLSSIRDDRVLSLFDQNGSGGHTVNPYSVEQDPMDPDIEYIYVYDNNVPADENRRVVINTRDNTWSYSSPAFRTTWSGDRGLLLMDPVSNYMTNPDLSPKPPEERYISRTQSNPDSSEYIQIYNPPYSNIAIVDTLNHQIGYANGNVFSTFDDGIPIIPLTGSEHPPIGYYLPLRKYNISVTDLASRLRYLSIFSDSIAFLYNWQYGDSTSQGDNFKYDSNGNQFLVYNSDEGIKSFDLLCISLQSNNEKSYEIDNGTIWKNDSLRFEVINEEQFKFSNVGQSKNYDLRLRVASAEEEVIFEHKDVQINASSSHTIAPIWDELNNREVPIFIDTDLDNVIDDTLYLINEYQGETPPTGGVLSNNNVYIYPNPFNPDNGEVGTIRYSLSKDGAVTIKIYDASNNLVRTLLQDAPKSASIELSEQWNGRNDNGKVVANGTYFYVITSSSGEKAVGKAAVLR